ncbi:MAG: hypothetical protein WDW36_001155 [Sanguina aurantia]
MLVYVPPHPLVKHWLAVMRNKTTPSPTFRGAAAELGRILIYEAVREFLPTVDTVVESPMGLAEATVIDPYRPIKVVPILRAGLVLLEQAQTLMPFHETYHVGYVRDEFTLQARAYLNKLPARLSPEDLILVTDPMLATGGTMVQVLRDIVARGASSFNIRVVCIVAAPPALKTLSEQFPGSRADTLSEQSSLGHWCLSGRLALGCLRIYTGIIDAELNENGYIIPGLGDAGDRAFGNTPNNAPHLPFPSQ